MSRVFGDSTGLRCLHGACMQQAPVWPPKLCPPNSTRSVSWAQNRNKHRVLPSMDPKSTNQTNKPKKVCQVLWVVSTHEQIANGEFSLEVLICFMWVSNLFLIFPFAFLLHTRLGSSHWQPWPGLLCGPCEPHNHLAASNSSSHPWWDEEIWVHPADGTAQQAVGDQHVVSSVNHC